MSLKEPIVEGAYRVCLICDRPRAVSGSMCSQCGISYDRAKEKDPTVSGAIEWAAARARRFFKPKGFLVPTDPAEVVAELREMQRKVTGIANGHAPHNTFLRGSASGIEEAADLVAEKLVGDG